MKDFIERVLGVTLDPMKRVFHLTSRSFDLSRIPNEKTASKLSNADINMFHFENILNKKLQALNISEAIPEEEKAEIFKKRQEMQKAYEEKKVKAIKDLKKYSEEIAKKERLNKAKQTSFMMLTFIYSGIASVVVVSILTILGWH